ncbi:unnamed protein product, partial [Polarella glacialis]
ATPQELIDQVKGFCRIDINNKAQWCAWCDVHCEGTKDPGRIPGESIQAFFEAYTRGELIGSAGRQASGGTASVFGGAQEAAKPQLADVIKSGQRYSSSFKAAWSAYCTNYGDGTFDPNKMHKEFLEQFLELLGTGALQVMGGAGVGGGLSGASGPLGGGDAYASGKRGWAEGTVGGAGFGGDQKRGRGQVGAGMDQGQMALVNRVKELQKGDDSKRKLWSDFCDQHAAGTKDPSRHDSATLQLFLDLSGDTGFAHLM